MTEGSIEREIHQYLDQIAADLQRDGWEVLDRETTDRLPTALRELHPDIVAVRGSEIMVGEVKSRNSNELQGLKVLADVVANLPNTRLEVFWFGDKLETEPARERVREYANEAAELLRIGHTAAAAVIAWTALEGAIDYFIEDTQAPVGDASGHVRNAWSLLSQLYSLGYINEQDFKRLTDLRKQRNAVVHFVERLAPNDGDVQYALDIVDRMIIGQYMSVDLMVDWFVDNYDYLIVGSPQQRPAAPAEEEVRMILRRRFPSTPANDLETAVKQIIREAPL